MSLLNHIVPFNPFPCNWDHFKRSPCMCVHMLLGMLCFFFSWNTYPAVVSFRNERLRTAVCILHEASTSLPLVAVAEAAPSGVMTVTLQVEVCTLNYRLVGNPASLTSVIRAAKNGHQAHQDAATLILTLRGDQKSEHKPFS